MSKQLECYPTGDQLRYNTNFHSHIRNAGTQTGLSVSEKVIESLPFLLSYKSASGYSVAANIVHVSIYKLIAVTCLLLLHLILVREESRREVQRHHTDKRKIGDKQTNRYLGPLAGYKGWLGDHFFVVAPDDIEISFSILINSVTSKVKPTNINPSKISFRVSMELLISISSSVSCPSEICCISYSAFGPSDE